VEKKGLDTLVAALALLPRDLAWRWTHIGGGELLKALKAQAKAAGVAERCIFLGARPQEEVIAAYRESDVFVLPCRVAEDGDRDGLPNVLMEAASQNVALVSTPVSGVTELIEDGATGAIVPPDDPGALAARLAALVRDTAERHRLGKAGARAVATRFDHGKAMGPLIALFPERFRTTRPDRPMSEPRDAAE
jgi:glycosyltransferase involved in cell wall biosynthesis